MLIVGLFLLTYHSPWSKVARRLLWKFKVIRLLVFYVTGLDLGGINKDQGIFATVQKQVKKLASTEMQMGGYPIPNPFVLLMCCMKINVVG